MLRVISLLLALALATIGAGTLAPSSALEASSHSAVRSFSQPWAPPGGRLVVTITATNYGGFGQVEETLPQGFSYTGSSLSEGSVTVDGQTVSFVLLGDTSFTYTVDVPGDEGAYAFSGVLKDANREEMVIGGVSQVLVGPEPTATPTPTIEPTATANPEPTVAPTSAPEPTEAPAVVPDATLESCGDSHVKRRNRLRLPLGRRRQRPPPLCRRPLRLPTRRTRVASEPFVWPLAGVLLLSAGFFAGYLVGRRKTA